MSKNNRGRAPLACALALGASMVGGDCDPDIANDPTFRDWCGDTLCAWKLDAGQIRPVPTWNANDLGVSFVETPTAISQATTGSGAQCILFTSVANLDPEAEMTLSVDFNSDGSAEYEAPLGSAQWTRVQTEITAPADYQGITFTIKKAGTGTAILAELRIQETTGCTASPAAIDAGSLTLGEKCASSADCAPGLTCTGAASDMLCAQCSSSDPCANGATCSTRSVFLPSQCGPGEGLGGSGEPCLAGSDCASAVCKGATPVSLIDDGGACDFDAALGASNPANCQWYGARGGTCD
jgi:hypothetical protein